MLQAPPLVSPLDLARRALRRAGILRPDALPRAPEAQDFTAFKRALWQHYQQARHLALLDSYLMQVARYVETDGAEGIPNLMIEMPPRHGKSLTAARLFPAWFLGRNPDKRVIVATYGASLAEKHSRYVRNVLRTEAYQRIFPHVRLATDSKRRAAWDIEGQQGGMDAVGKGGAVTGKGAHVILTDDLVKNRAEAESIRQRDRDWAWFQDDLNTRAEPHAAHITIGTRWHVDDVHGRIHRNEADLWTVLRLPALAEANDPVGRTAREALWPERFDAAALELTRRRMGDYSFEAEYQQSPTSRDGGLFKTSRINLLHYQPADIQRRVRFWDLAFSERSSADYTCGVLLGVTSGRRLVVLDVVRVQRDWDAVPDLIARVALADGAGVQIGIEKAYLQNRALTQLLKRPDLHKHTIRGFAANHDKFTRALPFAARVGEDLVDCVVSGWTDAFLDELRAFPNGAHDDQVDAVAQAYYLLEKAPVVARRSAG